MDQTENNVNRRKRTKLTSKELIIVTSIFIFCTAVILFCYYIFREDYKSMAENAETYSGNAQISATEGIISYKSDADGNITDEQMTPEDVLKGINNIATYLKSDSESSKEEKLAYLLNAGLVTKFPYIDGLPEDKVNGVVKFYRYAEAEQAEESDQEKYLLEFVNEEAFDQAMEAYETSGSLEVFNYFTIDENQQLVIACRSETTKLISTEDPDVTVDVINGISEDQYAPAGDKKFLAKQNTITKQQKDYQSIIEQYTMPFNLLAALLVQTGDYGFVKELADMAYESEIHIGIYENASITEKQDKYTYNKRIEYSPNTALNFNGFSTSNPQMNEQTVQTRFPGIIRSCIANMPEEVEGENWKVTHTKANMNNEPAGTVDPGEVYTKFVQSYSGSQISALSNQGVNFETTYWTRTESRTSVTIGTILADTWVARWEATYIKEQNDPTPGPTTSNPPDSVRSITKNGLKLFAENSAAAAEVKDVLDGHSRKLKDAAVIKIINNTTVTVATPSMASMIKQHAKGCEECRQLLNTYFGGTEETWMEMADDSLVKEVKDDPLLETVKEHANERLQSKKAEDLAAAKADFKEEVENGIGIIQYPSVAQSYVSISVTPEKNERISFTHKQQTPDRTDDGIKFKTLFNNSEFHESKRAILDRISWFWEYIREYDDTAKFEDILRYLLNIATDSNKFGIFSDEEIENLFKVFEPRELQNASNIQGKSLLREYICSWENGPLLKYLNGETSYTSSIEGYIDKNKTVYYVYNDGYDNPTVGFGIDIFNGGYYDHEKQRYVSFLEVFHDLDYSDDQLKNMSGKTAIPIDVVDDLKEKRIEFDWNEVEKQCYRVRFNTISKVCVNFKTL